MVKIRSWIVLILVFLGIYLITGSAFAGSISLKKDGDATADYPHSTIATERLGAAYDVYGTNGADAPLIYYNATISLNQNDIITFKLSNAKFNNVVKLCIYDGTNNDKEGGTLISPTPSASAPQDFVTYRINTDGAGKMIFILGKGCASTGSGNDYDAIPLLVNSGLINGTKIEISVPEAYIAGTTFTLSGALVPSTTILTVENENTVTVTADLAATIDFDADMMKFVADTYTTQTESKPALKRTFTGKSISAGDLGASDSVKVTIEGDMSGIKEIFWDLNNNNAKDTGETFTIDAANNKATITVAGNNPGVATNILRTVYIVVNGTVPLNPRTLKVTYLIDFADPSKADRTLASAEDFSIFVLNAYQALVPFVRVGNGYATTIVFTSSYIPATGATSANKIKASTTCLDGTSKVIDINTDNPADDKLQPGRPGRIYGFSLANAFGATCVGDAFAVTFTINAPQNKVAGYAVMDTPLGTRRIPVKDTNTLQE